MNKEEFVNKLKDLNIEINDDILNKLDIYYNFLVEYNSHTNLTSITDEDDVYLKHFYDSLTIVKSIDLSTVESLIDVGTGAGFPGMVLAIVYPNLKVTLLDSNNKRINFLNELKDKLGITNVTTIHDRSEIYSKNHKDMYDIVTARAVKNMKELTELCLPLVKVNGYFIPLKGIIEDELDNAKDIITKINGNIEDIISFELPNGDKRNIIKIKKIDKCPDKYPREYKEIVKDNK
ncbi:MAG: 16S rRNA (guanine(527)-N(7))-methyltransferase RsmG [Bacilli bacterium]|nr:16S rRNA (guanine(527)-N(7))-methyltransferase RsmG [Bacilli bacterium]